MTYLDKYAVSSRLYPYDPILKFLYFILFSIIALLSNSNILLSVLMMIILMIIIKTASISIISLVKLYTIPLFFISFASIPLLFSLTYEGGIHVQLRSDGYASVLHVFMRSLACLSALYFFILSSSISQIMSVMKRMMIPAIFVELTMLVYNGIFILTGTCEAVYLSQRNRLGYNGISSKYKDFSLLLARSFVLSFKQAEKQWLALESRAYSGSIDLLGLHAERTTHQLLQYVASAVFALGVLFVTNYANLP